MRRARWASICTPPKEGEELNKEGISTPPEVEEEEERKEDQQLEVLIEGVQSAVETLPSEPLSEYVQEPGEPVTELQREREGSEPSDQQEQELLDELHLLESELEPEVQTASSVSNIKKQAAASVKSISAKIQPSAVTNVLPAKSTSTAYAVVSTSIVQPATSNQASAAASVSTVEPAKPASIVSSDKSSLQGSVSMKVTQELQPPDQQKLQPPDQQKLQPPDQQKLQPPDQQEHEVQLLTEELQSVKSQLSESSLKPDIYSSAFTDRQKEVEPVQPPSYKASALDRRESLTQVEPIKPPSYKRIMKPQNKAHRQLKKWYNKSLLIWSLMLAMIPTLVVLIVIIAYEAELSSRADDLHDKLIQLNRSMFVNSEDFNHSLEELVQEFYEILENNVEDIESEFNPLRQTAFSVGNDLEFRSKFHLKASSCAAILALSPYSPSGYYWIRSYTGNALNVYCEMTRSCGGVAGGWTRVAGLDTTNSNNSQSCPSILREYRNTRGCHSTRAGCASVRIHTSTVYSKVCGRIKAYQYGGTDAFMNSQNDSDIGSIYVDGISLTYGSPRQHIWTFAAAADETGLSPQSTCHCTQVSTARSPPAFVGDDYFCDTGSHSIFDIHVFYNNNPLWDGAGCGVTNRCCSFNNPPWFYKQLSTPTTDDMEMRVCKDESTSNEDIVIESYEIYVQ